MDAQPKIGGFGCFKGVLQIPFFLLMQFHKAIFYFNPKMGHMLNLAIVDKLNRAGFVVAPYNTPEEVPSVKSVSGPARHVGEADKRVRDSRGGSPCGENRCGIGECREGEGTRGAPQERAKLTRTIFYILRSEVSSIEKYDAPRRMYFLISLDEKAAARLRGHHNRAASRICIKRKEAGLVRTVQLNPHAEEREI